VQLKIEKDNHISSDLFGASGSFLFVGQAKDAKINTAKELAKFLNCSLKGQNGIENYCGRCNNCQMIEQNYHPDIVLTEPKGASATIKIDDIRRLKERVYLKPFQAVKKFFIISEAQRLTQEASNALLKVLEEPPEDAFLILVSPTASQLLPTIVSRCKLIRFHSVKSTAEEGFEDIDALVEKFLDNEDMFLYEEVASLERSRVEVLLEELSCACRDVIMSGRTDETVMQISRQPKHAIKKWAKEFETAEIEEIIELILSYKNSIHRNANVKLSIDLLVKRINRFKKSKSPG